VKHEVQDNYVSSFCINTDVRLTFPDRLNALIIMKPVTEYAIVDV